MKGRAGVALWFAGCSAVAWTGGAVMYAYIPPLAPIVFGVAGLVAGLHLSTFASVIGGMVVTAVVGTFGSVLPVTATQALSAGASATEFTVRAVAVFVVAYGLGAGVGFIGVLRRSTRAYLQVVGGFVAGGAIGGLLLGVSWGASLFVVGALAMIAPWIVGGVVTAGAIEREALADQPLPWATRRGAIGVVLLLAVTLGSIGYWVFVRAREQAERVRPLAAVDGAIMGERAALYNGLRRLASSDPMGPEQREALEIYIAVRYREWLASGPTWAVPELAPLGETIRRKHADKTESDLLAASQHLGATYLDDLNRPYRPR